MSWRPPISRRISKQSVGVAIKDSGGNSENFKVEGRDVLLPNDVADRSPLARTVDKVDGVRLVSATDKTFAEAPMAQRAAEALEADKTGAEKMLDAGKKSLTTGWADPTKAAKDAADKAMGKGVAVVGAMAGAEKAAEAAAKSMMGAKCTPDAKAPEAGKTGGAKTGGAMSGADAKGALKALPAAGVLDAAQCQTALNATLALDKIQFTSGGVAIRRAAAQVLDRLEALLQRCPEQKVEDWRPHRQCRRGGRTIGACSTPRRQGDALSRQRRRRRRAFERRGLRRQEADRLERHRRRTGPEPPHRVRAEVAIPRPPLATRRERRPDLAKARGATF